tara:strand:- start:14624 stop:15562 length:939 start_codon:yes stop_codon:yes gene_type:complete
MSNFAIIYPGQGSQSLGMLSDLSEKFPQVKETFNEASEIVNLDLWSLSQLGPERDLNITINTQPIMLAASISIWRIWLKEGGAIPEIMAGHSLGEYSALVAAGSINFKDAVELVSFRGKLMQKAVPEGDGAMAAILGLTDFEVKRICEDASQAQVVEAVNFNSPGQVVIAGNVDAVKRAIDLSKESGAKRAILLDVSVPSHCSLMNEAATEIDSKLQKICFSTPNIDILHNVNAKSIKDNKEIRNILKRQLNSPVLWSQTIKKISDDGIKLFFEFGPGKVLSNLCRRIDKNIQAFSVNDFDSLNNALELTNV